MDYENRNNAQEMCMDWNDAIENDGQEFVTLEEGDYNFTVTGFERGRFPGSVKIPPCNKAAITIAVERRQDRQCQVRPYSLPLSRMAHLFLLPLHWAEEAW